MIKMKKEFLRQLFISLTIIFSTVVAFYPIVQNGYNIDDELVTKEHKYTSLGWKGIQSIWINSYYSDEMGYDYGYRPVVLSSFAIEHAVWGESPEVGHLIQLLLYVILNLSLFVLLRKVFFKIPWYWILATVLLFSLHPIHSEVVASLKNRDELLAMLFGILSMLVLLKIRTKYFIISFILSGLLFLLALWSKKSALPLLAMWFVVYPHFKALSNTQRFWGLEIYFAIVLWGIVDLQPSYWLLFLLLWTVVNYLIHLPVKIKGKKLQLKPYIVFLPFFIVGFAAIGLKDAFLWILTVAIAVYFLPNKRYTFLLTALMLVIGVVFFKYFLFLMLIPFWAWWNRKEFHWNWRVVGVVFVVTTLLWGFFGFEYIQYRMLLVVAFLIFTPLKLNVKIISALAFLLTMGIIKGFKNNDLAFLAFLAPLIIILLQPRLKGARWVSVLMIVLIAIPFADVYLSGLPAIQIGTPDLIADEKSMLDARQLEFAENPLAFNYHWVYNVAMGVMSIMTYIKLLFVPFPLSFYYGYNMLPLYSLFSLNGFLYFLAVSLILFLTIRLVVYWKKKKQEEWYYFSLTGLLILLISLAMFSNVIILVAGIVAERLMFVGSLGFVILVISLSAYIIQKIRSLRMVFLGLFVLVGIGMIIWDQKRTKMWKNAPTLMQRDILYLEQSSQAHNLYALALMQYSIDKEKNPKVSLAQQKVAITHFKKAVEIDPTFFNAAFDMGRAMLFVGDMNGALEAFLFSLTINKTNYLEPYKQVCYIYFTKGLYHEAAKWAQEAKKIDPYGTEWDYYIQQSIGR